MEGQGDRAVPAASGELQQLEAPIPEERSAARPRVSQVHGGGLPVIVLLTELPGVSRAEQAHECAPIREAVDVAGIHPVALSSQGVSDQPSFLRGEGL